MLKGTLGLLAGAAAAYGLYKYSKMTAEEKNALKARGKDFMDKNLNGFGDLFGKKATTANGSTN
ncbi:MAG: hypothetical protein EOO05_15335 [Chitinophagaceae bacterium]|nr:MAG: hypothetical protein EOO05_15335 [Chitinophagaceae bacterium]